MCYKLAAVKFKRGVVFVPDPRNSVSVAESVASEKQRAQQENDEYWRGWQEDDQDVYDVPQYFVEIYASSGYKQEVLHLLERYKIFVLDGQKGDKEKTEFLIDEMKKSPFSDSDRNDLKKFRRDQLTLLKIWLDLMAHDNVAKWLEFLKKINGYSDPNYRGCQADPLEEAKKISPFPEGSHLLMLKKDSRGIAVDTSLLAPNRLFGAPDIGTYVLVISPNSKFEIYALHQRGGGYEG